MIDLETLRIGHKLGEGGEGRVYAAVASGGTKLALKLVELGPGADRALFERRVARFAEPAADPPVIRIEAHGRLAEAKALRRQLEGAPADADYLIMKLITAPSLHAIAAAGPLPPALAAAILGKVALKLARLPAGEAHGDLRAPNVFVEDDGAVELADPDLFHAPDPGVDLRALGALGGALLGDGPADGAATGGLPFERLRHLLAELERSPTPPAAEEAGHRFADLASALSSSAALAAATRARVTAARPVLPPLPDPAPAKPAGKRGIGKGAIVSAISAAVVVLAILGQYVHHPFETTIKGNSGGILTPAPGGGRGLYDKTGKVKYDGPVHELGEHEKLQKGDGFVAAETGEVIPRFAILSVPDKKVLWERLKPEPARAIYLDVKPDDYIVEVDRDLGPEGIQHDQHRVHINVNYPFRIELSNDVLSAPDE